MDTRIQGLCWLLLALPPASLAQDTETAGERASEIDALEPGMSTEALASMEQAPAEDRAAAPRRCLPPTSGGVRWTMA